jgi:asparagine synthase (glutamine-hydrolysing)
MCGIAGFVDIQSAAAVEGWQDTARRMTASLRHRGPDASGIWCDAKNRVVLAHRRLAIIDLTDAGAQPMVSASGRYAIAFNGEIYNFLRLRSELEAHDHRFRGNSDTEVALAAFEQWGLEDALNRFIGMFAFALWDRAGRTLHLIRDRMGEKPLYYGWAGRTFLFGSELKALRAHPAWCADVNRDSVASLLRYGYIPAPYSIYKDIFKLLPGTILTLRAGADFSADDSLKIKRYWQLRDIAEAGVARPSLSDDDEAVAQLDELLRDSVRQQMVADVPLGAFLSGGVDSSTVVALMQAQSRKPVRTFTIGFHEQGYDEAAHARAVARHLKTDHTELYVTPTEAMDVIPKLPDLYDEPFADPSQIPIFLLSQLARRQVTVSLSGDAGDELFGGYNRYIWGRRVWRMTGWMPSSVRRMMAASLSAMSRGRTRALVDNLSRNVSGPLNVPHGGDKLQKLAGALALGGSDELYLGLVSHWKQPESVVLGTRGPSTALTDRTDEAMLPDFTERMMYLDMITYLPDDILVKVDRAAMGISLETRIPFLDHRVVEFAWCLPLSMKIRRGQGKCLLRQVLNRYLPKKLIERPKAGFAVPIDAWLRGPLCEWAEALLDDRRLQREGFFDAMPIRQKWKEHLSGRRNWQYHLWNILMFQAWQERWNTDSRQHKQV